MERLPFDERRAYPRFMVRPFAELVDMDGLTAKLMYQVCMLVDISLGGAKIMSSVEYPVGHMLKLVVALCDSRSKVKLTGEIVRVRQHESGEYEYGVKFVSLSDDQRQALAHGIECIARCK